MVNRKVDRMIMSKLSSTLGEIMNPDKNSYKKVLKRRNVIKSKLDQIVSDEYKNHVIDKLQNVIDPYLLKNNLFEWNCGCLLTEEENAERLCDCPRPNNIRNNPKKVIVTDCDTNEEKTNKSNYAASKDLGINSGLITMCCKGENRVKCGISKTNGKRYKFKYFISS